MGNGWRSVEVLSIFGVFLWLYSMALPCGRILAAQGNFFIVETNKPTENKGKLMQFILFSGNMSTSILPTWREFCRL